MIASSAVSGLLFAKNSWTEDLRRLKKIDIPFLPVAAMEKGRVGRDKTRWETINGRMGRNGFRASAE